MVQLKDYCQSGLMVDVTVNVSNCDLLRYILPEPKRFNLNLPGRHNALNAVAALVLALVLRSSPSDIFPSLRSFPGVARRFNLLGELDVVDGKAQVFEDYGHHPNEVATTIEAARAAWPDSRVVMVFQPHRYTRLQRCMRGFVECLKRLDCVFLLEVYSCGEAMIPKASSEDLFKKLTTLSENDVKLATKENLYQQLDGSLRHNDVVIFQGAGDVGALGKGCVASMGTQVVDDRVDGS